MGLPKVEDGGIWVQAVGDDPAALGDTGRTFTWKLKTATGSDWRPIGRLALDGDQIDTTNADYLRQAVSLCVESVTDSDTGETHELDETDAVDIATNWPNHMQHAIGWALLNWNALGRAEGKAKRNESSDA